MRNRQTTRHAPNRRLLQRGTTSFAVMTLVVGLTLDRAAEAADPIQVVAVSGTTVCSDFSTPDLVGPDTKVSGNTIFNVIVAGATVEVEVHTSQTKADFVVLDGPGVDAVVEDPGRIPATDRAPGKPTLRPRPRARARSPATLRLRTARPPPGPRA